MFQGPDNWAELTWQQKRDIRLEGWARRVGIKFDSPEAEKNYKARTARLAKAVRMEIPDRVPCMVPTGWFPAINVPEATMGRSTASEMALVNSRS